MSGADLKAWAERHAMQNGAATCVDGPAQAYTERRTIYRTLCSGGLKDEGMPTPPFPTEAAAREAWQAEFVKFWGGAPSGAALVWRYDPQINWMADGKHGDQYTVYSRLCFETVEERS